MKTLVNAGREWGWLLALAAVVIAVGLYYVQAPEAVLPSQLEPPRDETALSLPASPVDIQLSDVACNAEGVEKALIGTGIYTYTAKHTTKQGASVFIRWTDSAGMLGQNAYVQVNGLDAYPEPDEKTKDCLRKRAKPSPNSTGGPR